MSNPQADHDAAALRRFDEAVFHALRRLEGARKAILIAVSGGSDSTALMVCLGRISGRLGLQLEVATLDHGLRPESSAEAVAVVARAKQLGLTAHHHPLALAAGSGVEQRARDARYAALEKLRLARGLDLIATAHTASDQAETLLMRLGRGAALKGAAAIQARTANVIRPLLGLTRADVHGYLSALGEGWHEDPMNADRGFLRVRVRRELLPLFEAVAGPRVVQHLAQFARYAAEDEGLLEPIARAALGRISRGAQLDAVALEALERPIRRRVIAQWLSGNKLEVDAALIEDILVAVRAGRAATLPGDQVLVNREGWLAAEPAPSRNFTQGPGMGAEDAL